MSKELSNPKFDYTQVSKDDAKKLVYFEGRLIASRKRVAEEIIKLGELLHQVQQLLANYSQGTFVQWLESSAAGLSPRSAYNAIGAYTDFGSFANLQNLEVSAMYALAKNEKAKKRAMRLADKGVKVTHSMARKLIEDTTEKPVEPPRIEPHIDDVNAFDETFVTEVDSVEDDDVCPKCGHFDLAPIDCKPGEMWRACNRCDHQWDAASGEDADSGTETPQETAPRPPRNGTDKPGDESPVKPKTERESEVWHAQRVLKGWADTVGRWMSGNPAGIDVYRERFKGPAGDRVIKAAKELYNAMEAWRKGMK